VTFSGAGKKQVPFGKLRAGFRLRLTASGSAQDGKSNELITASEVIKRCDLL
jgi:hypothetical protein